MKAPRRGNLLVMERLSSARVIDFLNYCKFNDVQILIHRRTARGIAVRCEDDEGDVQFPSEMWEKLMTFLQLNDQQIHYSGPDHSVSIYAFVRILGQLKQAVRQVGLVTRAGSVSATPSPSPEPHVGSFPVPRVGPQSSRQAGAGDPDPNDPLFQ